MNLSDLPNRIRKLMETVNPDDVALVSTLKTAAESFEHVLKTSSDIRYACEQETLACERGAEIERLQKALEHERKNTLNARAGEDVANKIIEDIAKAAECGNFADIILARVAAQNQQSNAMTRICEGHVATARRETAKANDYLTANKELSTRIDVLNNQCNKMRAALHNIADELGAGSRNSVPATDWYLEQIRALSDLRKVLDTHRRVIIEKNNLISKLENALGEISALVPGKQMTVDDVVDRFRRLDIARLLAKAADFDSCKGYKWDKQKTDALVKLLSTAGMWPEANCVDGLNRLTVRFTEMKSVLEVVAACFPDNTGAPSYCEIADRMRGLDIPYLVKQANELVALRNDCQKLELALAEIAESFAGMRIKMTPEDLAANLRGLNLKALIKDSNDLVLLRNEHQKLEASLVEKNNLVSGYEKRIDSLKRSEAKLHAVAIQVDNWQKKTGTYVCDDPTDPDWAKQYNATMGLMLRNMNDAERSSVVRMTTLLDFAAALEIRPEGEGWPALAIDKIKSLMWPTEQGFRIHFRNLESANAEFDRCKNRIAAANARWNIKVADPTDYVKQLDYLIDEIEVRANQRELTLLDLVAQNVVVKNLEASMTLLKGNLTDAQKCAAAVRGELDLAVGAIRRMHANLLMNKNLTGIWPTDDVFRAKLDEIEWCLNVYVSRCNEAQAQHNADTRFIADVRDSLSHEILRRNKQ